MVQVFEGLGCRYKGSLGSLGVCLDAYTHQPTVLTYFQTINYFDPKQVFNLRACAEA